MENLIPLWQTDKSIAQFGYLYIYVPGRKSSARKRHLPVIYSRYILNHLSFCWMGVFKHSAISKLYLGIQMLTRRHHCWPPPTPPVHSSLLNSLPITLSCLSWNNHPANGIRGNFHSLHAAVRLGWITKAIWGNVRARRWGWVGGGACRKSLLRGWSSWDHSLLGGGWHTIIQCSPKVRAGLTWASYSRLLF